MKKITFIAAICAALVACNKEDIGNTAGNDEALATLTATIDIPQTKVAPNASELASDTGTTLNFHWEEGDVVYINLKEYTLDNSSISGKPDPSTAIFKGPETPAEGDIVQYNGALTTFEGIFTVEYIEGSFKPSAIGVVNEGGTSFTMNTINPVLRFQLKGSASIKKIGYNITGKGSKFCYLVFPTALQLSSTVKIVYFPLATTISKGTTLYFYDESDNILLTKKIGCDCEANKIYKMPELTVNPVILSGKFSVNSSGKQVQFTRGNLYWDGSDWRLEEKQTDYPKTWNTSHVGHFFWSKTAAVTYGEAYSDSDKKVGDALFCAEDTPLAIGGTSGLFALTADEWTYLLNVGQKASYRTDNYRFAHARVNGVCGLLIFPDGYNGDKAISGVTGIAAINTADAGYPEDSVSDWSALESAGCVFLPDAGCRYNINFGNLGNAGSYWTATSSTSDADKACCMVFTGQNAVLANSDGHVSPSNNGARQLGASIRMVRTVE